MLAESPGEHAAGLQQGYEISREISRSFQSSMQNNESGNDAFDLMAVAAGRVTWTKPPFLFHSR